MFGDLDNYHDEDETLEVIRRYQEMLMHRSNTFFDLNEFECIVDYYIEQFSFKDAISAVSQAIRQHPYASSMKLKYVQLLIETGKPAKALGIIRSLDAAESTNFELFLAKGMALNLTGKHREAGTFFRKALCLCGESRDEVAYSIAQSYIQIGKHAQAIHYLMEAYRFNEDNILVLYDLALQYEKVDCLEKSIVYYNKYLELDPFAEHVWNNLGLLHTSLNDCAKATECFDMAIAINPRFSPAYYGKAEMLVLNQEIQEAIIVYHELLQADERNTKAWCDLGHCHLELCHLREALQCFRKALVVAKDCSDAWYGAGLVYFHQKKYRMSVQAFGKAAAIQPDNADYWFMIGEVQASLRNYDQSIQAYTRVCEIIPFDLAASLSRARDLFRTHRIKEAIADLLQLYPFHPGNATISYRLAAYYAYLGEMEKARNFFQIGLSLNFQEHRLVFREFPKTKRFRVFHQLVDQYVCQH
jgi:tetratricopeptide (TPR) repeat protein